MAATARVVENLGVSAYLGAAHLISDPQLLTAAASIMTVEARHQTVLNILSGGSTIPQPFDIALLPNEVLAVASPFIQPGCDVGVARTSRPTSMVLINAEPSCLHSQCQPRGHEPGHDWARYFVDVPGVDAQRQH